MSDVASRLEQLVLAVHHRNGGELEKLTFSSRLLDPALRLDSLDLAEIMVGIEKELGVSPFESDTPPRTWADVVKQVQG
jgi:acyl carrier protein